MSPVTLDQILAIAPAELAQKSGDALFEIKNSADLFLTHAKTLAAHVDRALDLKYADRARAFRLGAGTCLTHSAMVPDVNAGEAAVRQVFEEYFPRERFESWNCLVIGSVATAIINGVGCAARISVDLFIADLWDSPGSETME